MTVPDDTRDELIEKAVRVIAKRRAAAAGSQAPDAAAFLADAREDVAALAGSGVLPDPAIDPTSTWVLNRVRETLGTPEGVRVTEHAKEVVKERDIWESEYERVRDLKMAELADGLERAEAWRESAQRALAERDERQARLDGVVALIDAATQRGPYYLSSDETRAVRAALLGDRSAFTNLKVDSKPPVPASGEAEAKHDGGEET